MGAYVICGFTIFHLIDDTQPRCAADSGTLRPDLRADFVGSRDIRYLIRNLQR